MLSSHSRWDVDVPPNIDLDRRQERNRQRMKSRFERIFEQYERDFTGQDDEIDLETGEIVVNNGHLESMPDYDGSEEFGGLLNLGHNAQYHDDFFHGPEQTPRGDDEEDELAAMCPVGLLAVAVPESSPRPAGSPAASPSQQTNARAPEETPHETSGKVDQVTEMEKQIQQMSRQLQELRQLVTQPSIQPLPEPDRPKDPKWYAPPLPNLPRRYGKSEDSVWDAPPLPERLARQKTTETSPVHDIEELEIPGPTKATAWDLATPVEKLRRQWTEMENDLIVELRGKNLLFREIAAQLPGRTTAQVVTHWHIIKDRLDKQNTVSESLKIKSDGCEEASNAVTRRREKLPLGSIDKNSKDINLTDASSAAEENETSNVSNTSEFDKSVAQPPVDVQLETGTDQRLFRRSRRKTLSTQSLVLPRNRGSASPPAAAQQPAAEPASETNQATAQPPKHSYQSSTQSHAEEVREWCKSKIGVTDNPRRPYFCQLCGQYWQTEEKVMSHFSKAAGCKALPLRRLRKPSKSSEPWTCVRCFQTWPTRAGADSHGADLSSCQSIALQYSTTDEAQSQRTSPNGNDSEDQPIPPSPMVVIPAWPRGRHNLLPNANDASDYSSETNGERTRRHRTSFAKRSRKDMSDPPPANETPFAKRTRTEKTFTTSTPTAPAGESSVQNTSPRPPQAKEIMDGSNASDHPENDLSTGAELIETPPTSFVGDAVDQSEDSNDGLASLFEEAGASRSATDSTQADGIQSASKATPAPTATQSQASSSTSTAACAATNTPKAKQNHIVGAAERNMIVDEVPQAELHGASIKGHIGEQEQMPQSPKIVALETQAPASPDGPPDSEDDTDLDLDDSAIQSMIEDPDSFIVESTEVDPDPRQLIGYLSPAKSESEDELQKASSPCPVLSENAVMLPKSQAGSSSPAHSLARRRRSQGRKPLAISLLDKEAPSASPRTPRRQQLRTKVSQRSLVKSSTKSAMSSFKTPVKPAPASKRSSSSSSSRKARQSLSAKSSGAKNSPLQKSSAPQKQKKSRLSDMLLPGGDSDDDLF